LNSFFKERTRAERRQMSYSLGAMYGGAAGLAVVEGLLPGGQEFSPGPGVVAAVAVGILFWKGDRLPLPLLAGLGPFGVALVGVALATTADGAPNDGAVLFVWPVLWTAYYFGRTGAIVIVACVGVADGLALLSLPSQEVSIDRWLDVMGTVGIVAGVVYLLAKSLSAEARVDKLTGLLNRRGFDERVAVERARAQRHDDVIAVVALDLDYFKRINDEWGHEAGDRVLSRVGEILRSEMRETDVVARMGGEEFVALLPDAGLEEGHEFAERVREACARDDGSGLPRVTMSAGVAAERRPAALEPLLQRADSALYSAKVSGRNRSVLDNRAVAAPVA
jgi:diguanylate cyclase (GGDEF)-like protein